MGRELGLAVVTALGMASALAAGVKIEVRPDGTKVIFGEPDVARERRLSAQLVSAPTAQLGELVVRCSDEHGLDPRLVQAVMQVESGYNPRALSSKGAIGLMQLMPETARELAVENPWDPEQNVRGGTTYLRRMMDTFSGDLELALAAYNAGPNAVLEYAGVPPFAETRQYVRKVLCLFEGDCGSDEPSGPKVRILRDAENRIVLTTAGSGG